MRWIWIDKFVEFESGRRAVAVKNVTLAEEHLHRSYGVGEPGAPPRNSCTSNDVSAPHKRFTVWCHIALSSRIRTFFHNPVFGHMWDLIRPPRRATVIAGR